MEFWEPRSLLTSEMFEEMLSKLENNRKPAQSISAPRHLINSEAVVIIVFAYRFFINDIVDPPSWNEDVHIH